MLLFDLVEYRRVGGVYITPWDEAFGPRDLDTGQKHPALHIKPDHAKVSMIPSQRVHSAITHPALRTEPARTRISMPVYLCKEYTLGSGASEPHSALANAGVGNSGGELLR